MPPTAHSLFWLLLQDKLNTRDKLRRRHMHLESYTCENYILQRLETVVARNSLPLISQVQFCSKVLGTHWRHSVLPSKICLKAHKAVKA
jgi:hypothetical protein